MKTSFTTSKMLFGKTSDQRKIRTYEQSSAVILRYQNSEHAEKREFIKLQIETALFSQESQ